MKSYKDYILEAKDTKIGSVTFRPYKEGGMEGWVIVNGKGSDVAFLEKKKSTPSTVVPHLLFLMKDGATTGTSIAKAWPASMKGAPSASDKTIVFAPNGLLKAVANWLTQHYKKLVEEVVKEETDGRVQVHYDSVDGYGKPIKVIATVPPMQEPAIDSKYELMRYLEKYIKNMKAKGVIKGKYDIIYPHDPRFRKSGKRKVS